MFSKLCHNLRNSWTVFFSKSICRYSIMDSSINCKRVGSNLFDGVNEDEIHHQQFIRNTAFFGESGQKRIEDAYIVVVGLGGVGSHAAHMLARSGVGRFKLIDFDIVTVSSLNRHSVAIRSDVGKPKVEVMRDHLLALNPIIQFEVHNVMLSKDNIYSLIFDKPDFVIDCIDDFTTKTDLLEFCVLNDIKVISSMGSGCRSNTTSLLVTNITDVKYDPLAAKIRLNLKKRKIDFEAGECVNPSTDGDSMKPMITNSCPSVFIPCISSCEKPVTKIMSHDASTSAKITENELIAKVGGEVEIVDTNDYGSSSSMRYRCIPVYACVPAAFGNTICSYILHSLSGSTYRPSTTVPLSSEVLMKMYNRFLTKEKTLYQNEEVFIDRFDMMFLIQQVFKQKSVFSNTSIAGTKLEFTRWDSSKKPLMDNVVLGTVDECKKHETDSISGMVESERKRIQGVIDRLVNQEEREKCYY